MDMPIAAGLQIIDADLYAKGIPRVYSRSSTRVNFDSLHLIDERFASLNLRK
jgi:hypothetical protein